MMDIKRKIPRQGSGFRGTGDKILLKSGSLNMKEKVKS